MDNLSRVDKFDRNYVLDVEKADGTFLRITRPFTVEFDIHRNSLSSTNIAQIRIYNLTPNNRNQLRKDQYDYDNKKNISFSAGYGRNLSVAFKGNITQAWSVREGTNIVTQIECFDGGFASVNAKTNAQFSAGTPQRSITDSIVENLDRYGVQKGAIGNIEGTISRGNSYSGNTVEIIKTITGGRFFIDNLRANCIGDNECIDGPTILINAKSGLIGTPLIENDYINLEMLFEPSVTIGRLVRLETTTASLSDRAGRPTFNGTHKVVSVHHRGVISDAVCGSAMTSIGLLPGTFTPIPQAVN